MLVARPAQSGPMLVAGDTRGSPPQFKEGFALGRSALGFQPAGGTFLWSDVQNAR